jgi:hypothetical protein
MMIIKPPLEVARNHSSFVKDEVPLAGRNIGLKVNPSL